MSSGIRNIIHVLQQDNSHPTSRTCNRGGQNLPFLPNWVSFFGGLTDHFELKLQFKYVCV